MSAAVVSLADHRKRREPPMLDLFGTIELMALANIACLFAFIALCRIMTEGPRADATRQ